MANRRSRTRSAIGPLEALEDRQLLARAVGYNLSQLLALLQSKSPAPVTQVQTQPQTSTTQPASTAPVTAVTTALISNTGVTAAAATSTDVPPEFTAAKAAAAAHPRQLGGPIAYLSGTLTGKAQGTPGTITLQQGSGQLTPYGKSVLSGTINFWAGTGQMVVIGPRFRALLLQVEHVQYKPSPATRSLTGNYVYHLQVGYRTADGTVTGPASGAAVVTVSLANSALVGYTGSYTARFYPTLG